MLHNGEGYGASTFVVSLKSWSFTNLFEWRIQYYIDDRIRTIDKKIFPLLGVLEGYNSYNYDSTCYAYNAMYITIFYILCPQIIFSFILRSCVISFPISRFIGSQIWKVSEFHA